MASIKQEPSGRWRVRIRKKGHKVLSETFRTKSSAQAWANSTEDKVERGELVGDMVAADLTVGNLLDKYKREVAMLSSALGNGQSALKVPPQR